MALTIAGTGFSTCTSKKLRVLLIPFFATSHIEPFTDLAIRLAAAAAVEATVAVTPANVSIVRSVLERHYGKHHTAPVKITTYPFPAVDGLPGGVENLGKAAPADSWRIDATAVSDALMRPAQEALVREQSPDALVTDLHFVWNVRVAEELGVPCVRFSVIGAFSSLAMRHLELLAPDVAGGDPDPDVVAVVPRFPGPPVRMPRAELPEFLRRKAEVGCSTRNPFYAAQADCFGLAVNTFSDLEQHYCEMQMRQGYVKRAYFLGPVSPRPSPGCIDWLDSKPDRSVVYVCFGSLAPVSDAQLRELALGLEASGRPFLWVVRAEEWAPPEGREERVRDRGLMVTTWAPQTAILGHQAVGAFVTHCGWNSVLETVAAGVPVLTWPLVFEQFITERLVTEVLGIGERLWPHGAGVRSTSSAEHELVPAEAVARVVMAFMPPGGPGDAARGRPFHVLAAPAGRQYAMKHLFYPSAEALKAAAQDARTTTKKKPSTLERLSVLPKPEINFHPKSSVTGSSTIRDSFSLLGRDGIVFTDSSGTTALYSTVDGTVATIPRTARSITGPYCMNLPMTPADRTEEERRSLYVMDLSEHVRVDDLFQVLACHQDDGWHWRALPAPPFVSRYPYDFGRTTCYTAVDSSTICMSSTQGGFGTYAFDTARHVQARVEAGRQMGAALPPLSQVMRLGPLRHGRRGAATGAARCLGFS
ncbi:unnamed protein product [Triticum turgidum subsp. durum]|uniref:UDP-glycosyltransferases domain-containing protein n=3 Tax=Triticum TaxID=4564 RepID=A0A9R0WT03_TRITD|nr:unnamed protein product [Triticum turgidum subsp. durum]